MPKKVEGMSMASSRAEGPVATTLRPPGQGWGRAGSDPQAEFAQPGLAPAHTESYTFSNSNFLLQILLYILGKWTVVFLLKRLETPGLDPSCQRTFSSNQ